MEQIRDNRGTDILSLISAHRRCIMGFAALALYAFHKHSMLFANGSTLYTIENVLKRIAFLGLDVFLLLSGLGLTYAIRREKLGTFYLRRLKRIALPFFVIGAITAILEHWDAHTTLGNLSGYYFFAKNMYSFMWYFPAICVLYALFPLYHKLLRLSRAPLAFTGIALCLWLLGSLLLAEPMKAAGREEFFGFTNRIPIFVIGVLFGEIAHGQKLYIRWPGWVLFVLLNALGLLLAYRTSFQKMPLLVPVPNCCVPNILLAVSLTCILAKLFDVISRVSPGRAVRRVFDLYGIISLELYAVQRIVMVKWAEIFPWTGVTALKNLTLLAMTTAAAVALYWLNCGFWALASLPFCRKRT